MEKISRENCRVGPASNPPGRKGSKKQKNDQKKLKRINKKIRINVRKPYAIFIFGFVDARKPYAVYTSGFVDVRKP